MYSCFMTELINNLFMLFPCVFLKAREIPFQMQNYKKFAKPYTVMI